MANLQKRTMEPLRPDSRNGELRNRDDVSVTASWRRRPAPRERGGRNACRPFNRASAAKGFAGTSPTASSAADDHTVSSFPTPPGLSGTTGKARINSSSITSAGLHLPVGTQQRLVTRRQRRLVFPPA